MKIPPSEFKHTSIKVLYKLYEEYDEQLGKGFGMMQIIWKSVSPQVPDMLAGLDKNPELLKKIAGVLVPLAEELRKEAECPPATNGKPQ